MYSHSAFVTPSVSNAFLQLGNVGVSLRCGHRGARFGRPLVRRTNMTVTPTSVTTSASSKQSDIHREMPGPGANFNQIVVHKDIVYLSGQVAPVDSCTNRSAHAQTAYILDNIDALLAKAGTDKSRLLSGMIWVTNLEDVKEVNEAWHSWVDPENLPVRACVQAALVRPELHVEIQVTAALPPRQSKRIETSRAAAAVGPYSQAVVGNNDTVYVSGCIGLTADTGVLAGDSVEAQTEQALRNLGAILDEAGATPGDIVKTTVLLDDMADFGAVNKIYEGFFDGAPVPARACFAAKQLPKGALVEIEAIAIRHGS